MRLAVLADIHSNHFALEACMNWIDENEVDGIIFAGDYVSDCPYPQKTMMILKSAMKKYQTWFVRGNREEIMIEKYVHGMEWDCHQGSLKYTYDNLTKQDISFFQSMPFMQKIEMEGYPSISLTHGDLHDSRGQVRVGSTCMDQLLNEMETSLHICGHSHRPFIYQAEDKDKMILNPGSVGIPVSGYPMAEMAVIEYKDGRWQPMLIRLEYKRKETLEEFKSSGLSDCAGVWGRCIVALLQTGRHYCEECLDLIQKYAIDTGKDTSDPELWLKAADELKI